MVQHLDNTDKLVLPDGQRLIDLRLAPLRRALEGLRVPGVQADMGKAALIAAWAAHIAPYVSKIDGRSKGGTPTPLTERVAKQAADVVARQAAEGVSADSPLRAPMQSIVSTRV